MINFLNTEKQKDYFKKIIHKYEDSLSHNIVFPHKKDIFKSFEITNIKVVIIGQDPYYSKCKKTNIPYANGLAFSVNSQCNIPSSLKNIFKELDYNRTNGDLTDWTNQGVFLLNTQLSVIQGKPNSHKFWNKFTDNVIKYISDNYNDIIFVLWGGNSLKKKKLIDDNKHHLFITSHPSPLSYKKTLKNYPMFYGYNIFNKINDKLTQLNKNIINW